MTISQPFMVRMDWNFAWLPTLANCFNELRKFEKQKFLLPVFVRITQSTSLKCVQILTNLAYFVIKRVNKCYQPVERMFDKSDSWITLIPNLNQLLIIYVFLFSEYLIDDLKNLKPCVNAVGCPLSICGHRAPLSSSAETPPRVAAGGAGWPSLRASKRNSCLQLLQPLLLSVRRRRRQHQLKSERTLHQLKRQRTPSFKPKWACHEAWLTGPAWAGAV